MRTSQRRERKAESGSPRPEALPPQLSDLPGRLRRAAIALVPHAAYAVLFVGTLHQWYVPFADTAREAAVPLRLLAGDVLYRDVLYQYGPLPPLLDALALALLGKDLPALVVVRLAASVDAIEALRRLVGRALSSPFLASAVVTTTVSACCFLPNGGGWPFPYSVAALEGLAGSWVAVALAAASRGWPGSLAAACAAGLAARTKLEYLPAALVGLSLALVPRRPRREAFTALALAGVIAAAAWLLPVALLGAGTMRS